MFLPSAPRLMLMLAVSLVLCVLGLRLSSIAVFLDQLVPDVLSLTAYEQDARNISIDLPMGIDLQNVEIVNNRSSELLVGQQPQEDRRDFVQDFDDPSYFTKTFTNAEFECFNESELISRANRSFALGDQNDLNRINATLQYFAQLRSRTKAPLCGCLRLEDEFPSLQEDQCMGPKSRPAECATKKIKLLVLAGDSTLYHYYLTLKEAAIRGHLKVVDFSNSSIISARLAKDLFIEELSLIISFRSAGLSSNMMMELLRRPLDQDGYAYPRGYEFANDWQKALIRIPNFDDATFQVRNWQLPEFIGDRNLSRLLKLCGPDILILTSGLWENPRWAGTYNNIKCGFKAPIHMAQLLWERRLKTIFKHACRYLGKNRFIWRNEAAPLDSNFTNINKDYYLTPALNDASLALARKFNIPTQDYNALYKAMSFMTEDYVHPVSLVQMRSMMNIFLAYPVFPGLFDIIMAHYKFMAQKFNQNQISAYRHFKAKGPLKYKIWNVSSGLSPAEIKGEAKWSVRIG